MYVIELHIPDMDMKITNYFMFTQMKKEVIAYPLMLNHQLTYFSRAVR